MMGPVRKTVQSEYQSSSEAKHAAAREEQETGEGFETIQNEIHVNHTVVQGLKVGIIDTLRYTEYDMLTCKPRNIAHSLVNLS